MSWTVAVHADARKYLTQIPWNDAKRIERILVEFERSPFGGDIEKMEGERNVWRRRIGTYRIFYEVRTEQHTIFVFRIERRASSTYSLLNSSF
ncbi:MAG: type II toxin-antitoxin system RelE/ParE family toxin [Patescibacteria group bacterium]